MRVFPASRPLSESEPDLVTLHPLFRRTRQRILLERLLTDYEIKSLNARIFSLISRMAWATTVFTIGAIVMSDFRFFLRHKEWYAYYAAVGFIFLVLNGLLCMRHFGPRRRYLSMPASIMQNDRLLVDLYMAGFRAADILVLTNCQSMHRTRQYLQATRTLMVIIAVIGGMLIGVAMQYLFFEDFTPLAAAYLALHVGIALGVIVRALDLPVKAAHANVNPAIIERLFRMKARGFWGMISWREIVAEMKKFWQELKKLWSKIKERFRQILLAVLAVALFSGALVGSIVLTEMIWDQRGPMILLGSLVICAITFLAVVFHIKMEEMERSIILTGMKVWRKSLRQADEYYTEFVNVFSEGSKKGEQEAPTFYGIGGRPKRKSPRQLNEGKLGEGALR